MANGNAWIILLLTINQINSASELSFRIQEEVPSGTVVASGSALTPLLGHPDSLPVIINRNSPGASSFTFVKIPHSGLELTVAHRVDRESICPVKGGITNDGAQISGFSASRPFHIEDSSQVALQSRYGHGYPSSFSQSSVSDCVVSLRVASSDKMFNIKIEIMDINDNAPAWNTSDLHLSVRDGDPASTILYLPLAEDLDAGLNGEITYSLQAGDGEFGGYSSANRHRGSHVNWFELIKHSENPSTHKTSGLMLPQQSSTPKLALRTKTLIDRELSPEKIELLLVARDAGMPTPLRGQLKIIINVTDVNDNAPMFERPLYNVDILSEDTPVGRTLLQLQAKDMDSGPNAELTYRFEDNGQPMLDTIRHFFEITPGGQLKVLRKLNVDKIAGERSLPVSTPITFEVEAVDGAAPAYALTGRTTVEIHVTDTNDEAPKIQVHAVRQPPRHASGTVEITAQENGSFDQLLALVEVSDPDLDGSDTVECHLKGAAADHFQLESTPWGNGKRDYSLTTSARLDRESTPRLEVVIVCRDSADHVSQKEVGINLLDVNDNPPKFDKPSYEFYIQENDGEADNLEIINDKRAVRGPAGETGVRAWDADLDENSKISYRLEPDPSDQASVSYFSIDHKTGSIFAVVSLDRETKISHKFIVAATDHGNPALSATAAVTVWLENLNDNVPQFVVPASPDGGYTFSIDENEPPGRFVGQVTAVDADDGDWSASEVASSRQSAATPRLIYSLGTEKDAMAFRIDKYSGNITVRERLDRETQSSYTFHVYVSDGVIPDGSVDSPSAKRRLGPPKNRVHTTSTQVTVNLCDLNDNKPTFIQPNATNHLILLDPTTTPGRSLLQINATDPDEGENGRVTYAIVDGNVGGVFYVAPVEGLLYLNGQIPRGTIEKATYASAAAAAATSSSVSPNDPSEFIKKSDVGWMRSRVETADEEEMGKMERMVGEMPSHPTYVLKLEACDSGAPRQCSTFPNLQIQLRVSSDHSAGLQLGSFPDHLSAFMNNDKGGNYSQLRNSLVEQVIIGLTVFFAVVVLVALLVVFLMRGGANGCSCKVSSSRRGTDADKIKQTPMLGHTNEREVFQRPNPFRNDDYTNSGATRVAIEGPFIDPKTGGHFIPGGSFSPIPQGLIDGAAYRNGYQMGNPVLTSHPQHPTGYGFLGPTSVIASRPPTSNFQPYRHNDYQCLDLAATRPGIFGPAAEAYYQTSQIHDRYDPTSYPIITTTAAVTTLTRNHSTLPRLPAEFDASLQANNELEEDNDGVDSEAGDSLELIKQSFPPEADSYNPPRPSATLQSSSAALARSRTLNFPKATFV